VQYRLTWAYGFTERLLLADDSALDRDSDTGYPRELSTDDTLVGLRRGGVQR